MSDRELINLPDTYYQAILVFTYFKYCENFAFWNFAASLRRRSAFRIVSNFYAISENVDGVKIGDDAK